MADLRFDEHNANKGTVRGRGMLERSLQQYGAGRAPVASADGVILAGNKTVEVARELGIPIREVESDGTTLFVIRRTDLDYDDPRARELAIADNRVGEVSLDWEPEILAALADDGIDLEQFWFEDELSAVLDAVGLPPSLDDLAAEYGDPDESAFWSEIRVKVPPDTYERWDSVMRLMPGGNDAERIARMLEVVDVSSAQ